MDVLGVSCCSEVSKARTVLEPRKVCRNRDKSQRDCGCHDVGSLLVWVYPCFRVNVNMQREPVLIQLRRYVEWGILHCRLIVDLAEAKIKKLDNQIHVEKDNAVVLGREQQRLRDEVELRAAQVYFLSRWFHCMQNSWFYHFLQISIIFFRSANHSCGSLRTHTSDWLNWNAVRDFALREIRTRYCNVFSCVASTFSVTWSKPSTKRFPSEPTSDCALVMCTNEAFWSQETSFTAVLFSHYFVCNQESWNASHA